MQRITPQPGIRNEEDTKPGALGWKVEISGMVSSLEEGRERLLLRQDREGDFVGDVGVALEGRMMLR